MSVLICYSCVLLMIVLFQMGVEELQAQLAEKTTLLSEARLKEQHFVDRVSVKG